MKKDRQPRSKITELLPTLKLIQKTQMFCFLKGFNFQDAFLIVGPLRTVEFTGECLEFVISKGD